MPGRLGKTIGLAHKRRQAERGDVCHPWRGHQGLCRRLPASSGHPGLLKAIPGTTGSPGRHRVLSFYLLTKGSDFEIPPVDHGGNGELLYDWNVLRYRGEGQLRYQEVPGAGSVIADLDAGLAVAFVEDDMAACS